jgi:DNA polymerase III gamma/tau subunit
MIPLIVTAQNSSTQDEFVNDLIKKEEYLPYYIFTIQPVKTEISIDQIRAIIKDIVTDLPHKRLFVIHNFDTASLEAQNAFLKTLEEKNEKNQFILLAEDTERILPTIKSRSKIISLDTQVQKEMNDSVKKLLSSISEKNDYGFLQPVSGISREDALKLFDHIIVILKEELKEGKKSTAVVLKKALQQKSLILSNNLNHQLAVDAYLIFYKKHLA